MKRKIYAILIIVCVLFIAGCGATDTIKEKGTEILGDEEYIETEDTETIVIFEEMQESEKEEDIDWVEYYQDILANYTSEYVNQIIIGDFKGDGMTQAFIITTPQPIDIDADYIETYFCASSLWYLDGGMCQNVYLDSDKYSVICESGYVQNKMIIAIGTLTAWVPEQNYDSTIWYVSEGSPACAGQMARVVGIEDGYLCTFFKTYGEDEEGEYRAQFEYTRYSFDNGTISYVDSYVE
ncbi:MAG: hypothetical protein MR012_09035 [Roseburia sp.]|nr:hypothetical protein [Roseburia sp.]